MKLNIKKTLVNAAKKSPALRAAARMAIGLIWLIKFKMDTFGIRIGEKTIIFCAYNGASYACSPKAIYEYMAKSGNYGDYEFVWAFREPERYKFLEQGANTRVVKIRTKEYNRALARARYWIFNYKIPDFLKPRKGQVFVQCWHGTPLKRLGFDLIHFDNPLNTVEDMKRRYRKEARKFAYFISPSRFASEKFISAWNLKETGRESIMLETGYPRNDFLFNYTEEDARRIRARLNIEGDGRKVMLYAPTYRADQHESGTGHTFSLELDFDRLKERLESEYIVLVRLHYFVADTLDFAKYKGFALDVSSIDDISELYIIADVLVTDYSSAIFDFANLKRPQVFYMYDLEHYRDESNGFYIDLEELPGPIAKTQDELLAALENAAKGFAYSEKYRAFNAKYNSLDDGRAAERVVKMVIG